LQVKPRRRKNVAQKTNEAGKSEIEVDVKDEEKEAQRLALCLVSFEIDLRPAADLPRRALAIVIAVVPIVLGVPTMLALIPPAMTVSTAILARRAQFAPRMVRLPALAPMMVERFLEMMIRLGNTLAATVVTGAQTRNAAEEQESRQRSTGQRYFPCAKKPCSSHSKHFGLKLCLHPVLLHV
jgi:hypothetical protein